MAGHGIEATGEATQTNGWSRKQPLDAVPQLARDIGGFAFHIQHRSMRSRQTTAVNSLDLLPFNRSRHRDGGDVARRRAPRQALCTDVPHFHVEHATVRLVCTYAGPTSEWLEERDVDRSLLAGAARASSTQPYAGMRPFNAARRSTSSCSRARHSRATRCARPFIVRRRIWSHGFSSRSIRSDDEPLDAHDRT
jgi:Protein of unknown function (DUF1826)